MASRPCLLLTSSGLRQLSSQSSARVLSGASLRTPVVALATSTTLVKHQVRTAVSANAIKYRTKEKQDVERRKANKNKRVRFITYNLDGMERYALCDAMRIIRAFEAGYDPNSPKYELAIKLRTLKDGPIVHNRLALPHPVRTDLRVAVICEPDSPAAAEAREAGAALVGTDEIFQLVRDGTIEFDRCICHEDSAAGLQKANLGRILGPRRLMPSQKEKTIVKDVGKTVRELMSSAEYREKTGVIRMSVGRLAFTPEEMSRNVSAFLTSVKKDMARINERVVKEIHEVVLSSTHGPGLSLNGEFVSQNGISPEELKEL